MSLLFAVQVFRQIFGAFAHALFIEAFLSDQELN